MHDHKIINVTLSLRRRPGHDPIPTFDDYIGCPPRERLPQDEFARRYGASVADVALTKDHYQSFGLAVDHHLARRHIYLTGTAAQFNAAFGVELHEYEITGSSGTLPFHAHATPMVIPEHLSDVVTNVMKLNTEPRHQSTLKRVDAVRPDVTYQAGQAYQQGVNFYTTLYNAPAAFGTGVSIAVVALPGGGDWALSDVALTKTHYGVAGSGSITTVTIDNIVLGSNAPEVTVDITNCILYSVGANVVLYKAIAMEEIISRVAFPNPGDIVCDIISISYGGPEPDGAEIPATTWEDAAMNNVTIFAASGDDGPVDARTHTQIGPQYPASCPWVTGVGGTTIQTVTAAPISFTNYAEVVWGNLSVASGGGISVMYARPNYQSAAGITFPPIEYPPPAVVAGGGTSIYYAGTVAAGVLSSGAAGRGVPDIAAVADGKSAPPFYWNGVLQDGSPGTIAFSGTSLAAPMMAGMFARVIASLQRPLGFINPTLYHGRGSFLISLNTGSGDNTVIAGPNAPLPPGETINPASPGPVLVHGYPPTSAPFSWNACTGLSSIRWTLFVNYVARTVKPIWVKIIASNTSGQATSHVSGPWNVSTS
jgi:kumamolisin